MQSYEEMGKLSYVMAVFLETLRMFPPVRLLSTVDFDASTHENTGQVINIPKCAEEDTTLPTQNMAGEKLTVPCPKGTGIIIHTPGLHYNRGSLYRGC